MTDDLRFKNRYRIPSARLASWDYRWPGVYSVTICTRSRICWFGEVLDGEMALSPEGRVVEEEWTKISRDFPQVALDAWIVMPDHVHGILLFQSRLTQSLGAVVGQFKSKTTKRIRMDLRRSDFAWQPRFHDTILREEADVARVRDYIRANPSRWKRETEGAG
ncbi:MAG: transposase [Thermoanaerobaculia bacterium]